MNLTERAFCETTSAITTAHHGGGSDRPFWNAESKQFLYVPSFQFAPIAGCEKYIYSALDENKNEYNFESDSPCALLLPIWKDIPEGIVNLKVFSTNKKGEKEHLIGARTFYKAAPFSENLPEAISSYTESASRAFDYCFNSNVVQHWLKYGTPDPHYNLNVYPSKMISSIIDSMMLYADICPEKYDDCIKIATNAADYLLSITESKESPLEGIPPTYYTDFRTFDNSMDNLTADERKDTIMMFYPSFVGISYLNLEKKIGDEKYYSAALKIGEYYRDNVLENGTWYLVVSKITGKPDENNYCMPTNGILSFLTALYERTGNECWKALADNALSYVENNALKTYNWEGQFEDSVLSNNYSNLAHGDCDKLIIYYSKNHYTDEKKMNVAKELMRFVEDQFVVWNRPCPWDKYDFDTTCWPTPCGLEQYNWSVPVDASTAGIAKTFFYLGKATGDELYFAKAKALLNTITRVQNIKDGSIPTEWISPESIAGIEEGREFWINCMLYTCCVLKELGEFFDEIDK